MFFVANEAFWLPKPVNKAVDLRTFGATADSKTVGLRITADANPAPHIALNGLVKDYDPPDGINTVTDLHFDPTAQDWQASTAFACPQGFAAADIFPTFAATLGMPTDTGVPITGTDRGAWVSGTTYAKYDKVIDPTDSQQYVALAAITSTVQPHSALNSWVLAAWNGMSPRSLDANFYGSVRRTGDATRWFSTEIHALANSSTTEPSVAAGGNVLDGNLYWARASTGSYRGAWVASTVYNTGDLIVADGSIWRAAVAGTSGGSAPVWTSTPNYGSSTADGPDILWQRRYVYQGAWTASTTYGYRVVNSGADVRGDAVLVASGTIVLNITAIKGTDGTTGSTEPAWSAAASGSFWADGTLIWRFGTFAVNDPTLQNERLILSGLAAATDGKTVTIYNDASAGTKRDVVLADRFALDRSGAQLFVGRDKESAHPFNFGGSNIRLAEGQSATVVYSTSTGLWTVAPAGTATSQTRDIRITGQLTDQTTRDIRLTAQDTTNTTRDLRITSQLSDQVIRDVRITGQAADQTTRDIRLTAQTTSSTTSDIRVQGQDSSNTTRNLRLTGQSTDNTTRDLRVTAQDSSSITRDVRVTAQDVTFAIRDLRVQGQDTSAITRDLRITGQNTDARTVDLRLTGQDAATMTVGLRIVGQLNVIRPASDISTGTWGATPIWSKLNEIIPNDTSLVTAGSTTDTFEVALQTATTPATRTDHYLRYRLRDPSAGSLTFTITLLEGTTQIAQWTQSSVPSTFTTYERALTQPQMDSITNYANLRVRITQG